VEYVNNLSNENLGEQRFLGDLSAALKAAGADPLDATIYNLRIAMQFINDSDIAYEFVTDLGSTNITLPLPHFHIMRKTGG
jgi:hypothetical protein